MPNAPRIELPRPAIIAALGALILVVTFVVTQGKTSTTSSPAPASTTANTTTTGTTSTQPAVKPKPKKPVPPAIQPGQGVPPAVARALDRREIVVLLFYEPAGADDQATRVAVRAVHSAGPHVALFTDTVSRISNYRRVVGSLGISQTPAMVVIDKQLKARLYQGFLDAGTIRQSVRDAL